jgi:hypothetical protein
MRQEDNSRQPAKGHKSYITAECLRYIRKLQGKSDADTAMVRHARSTALATVAIAFFSLASLVASIFQYLVFSNQLKAMQSQVGVMEADQRPWIKVEASPGDYMAFPFNPNYPIANVFFNPHFTLTNVGKAPAFNAQLYLAGYAVVPGHSDPDVGQKEMCDRARVTPLDNPYRGRLLFPGDAFDEQVSTAGQYNVAFMGPEALRNFNWEDGSFTLTFYVVGCVDYIFGTPAKHHQTGFIYEVWQVNDNHTVQRTFDAQQSISRDHIRMNPGPSSTLAD